MCRVVGIIINGNIKKIVKTSKEVDNDTENGYIVV